MPLLKSHGSDAAVLRGRPEYTRADALARFKSVFDCDGSILHQNFKGAFESPLAFWFGVGDDGRINGAITKIGAPLDLPRMSLSGELFPHYNHDGAFTGGQMLLDWPFADANRPVELALVRETFIRSGYRVNGVGKIIHRTSKHTYLAGRLWFDPASHPTLASFYRISFVSATCYPAVDLPGPELTN